MIFILTMDWTKTNENFVFGIHFIFMQKLYNFIACVWWESRKLIMYSYLDDVLHITIFSVEYLKSSAVKMKSDVNTAKSRISSIIYFLFFKCTFAKSAAVLLNKTNRTLRRHSRLQDIQDSLIFMWLCFYSWININCCNSSKIK